MAQQLINLINLKKKSMETKNYDRGMVLNPSNIDINEVSHVIKIKDEGKLRATLILQYKDLKIKGFRIVRSKYENNEQELWLQVPSYFAGGRYHKMFFLENEESWKILETRVFKSYKEEYDKYYKKKFGLPHAKVDELEEETSIDDIPM